MSETIISSLTLESLRECLQQAGYRVEILTDPVAKIQYLRSATAGLGFDIRPGNRLPADDKSFADAALVAVLQIAGDLPLELVNRWNASRRFGRLQFSAPFLVLCLDISVVDGATPAHLRAQIALWDHLLQDLMPFLRGAIAESAQSGKPVERTNGEQRSDAPSIAAA